MLAIRKSALTYFGAPPRIGRRHFIPGIRCLVCEAEISLTLVRVPRLHTRPLTTKHEEPLELFQKRIKAYLKHRSCKIAGKIKRLHKWRIVSRSSGCLSILRCRRGCFSGAWVGIALCLSCLNANRVLFSCQVKEQESFIRYSS